MVEELNALLAHNERQAEEARTHAGNLAHALKTPLTVIMNAATAQAVAALNRAEAAVKRFEEMSGMWELMVREFDSLDFDNPLNWGKRPLTRRPAGRAACGPTP